MKPRPRPAEVTPVGEYIRDEVEARGWTLDMLARRMGLDEVPAFVLNEEPMPGNLDERARMADRLALALGTSSELWLAMDLTHRRAERE